MTNNVTLEQVEQMAMRLPAVEQLKLLARISTRLSSSATTTPLVAEEADLKVREAQAAALLQELDAIADSIEIRSASDAAEDLRQIREERAGRI